MINSEGGHTWYWLINNILDWGQKRGLHETQDLKPQLTKLIEELGEIAAGVARHDDERIVDGVGDLLVVLIQFGAVHRKQWGTDPADYLEDCLNHAWAQIKDRAGKTKNGVFIKMEEGDE